MKAYDRDRRRICFDIIIVFVCFLFSIKTLFYCIFIFMYTSESDYKLYIQEADYIFKGPIIYSRSRLYILNGALSIGQFTN